MLTPLTTNQNLICLEAYQAEIFLVDYSHSTLQLLPSWLTVTFFLFFTGLLGMMYNYRSFLVTMMSVEVMYLGAVMSFVLYSIAFKDSDAAIYALLILIFTACESAVGLGLLIVLYRFGFAVTFDAHSSLHSSTLPIATMIFAHGEGTSFFTRNLFHLASNQYMQTHFGLALYALFALLLCGLLATLAYLLSLSTSQDTEKRSEYECGFAPFDSATRLPFDVHFYLVGILFLIFDVEVALLFPWTIALSSLTWYGFFSMVGFVVVLTIGFIYEWKRGALIWPSRQRSKTSTAHRLVGFLPLVMSANYAVAEHAFLNFIVSIQEMHNYAENLFGPLLPEMVLAGGVLLIILLMATDFARYGRKHNFRHTRLVYDDVIKLLLLVMVLVLVSLLSTAEEARLLLSGYLFTNSYTTLLKLLVLGCSYIVLRAAREYVVLEQRDTLEFSIIYALAVLFLLLLVSANHLMSAFLALVGFSLNMYVLILFNARQHVSREAGIKYYYLSTFSTGFILYGMFLIYAFAKSGMFAEIDAAFNAWPESLFKLRLVHFGLLLIFVGFMFKLSAFPGHLWAADVYEGSPLAVTAFFMLPVKVAVLAFFLRFLSTALSGATVIWQPWLVLASIISMAWGALAATTAKSTLRFAAFTSINQMGFLLIGPACVTFEGYRATLSYLFIYALMSTVFLIVLVSTRLDNGDTMLYLTDLRSLGRTDWSLSWALIATVFSMAGIPPLVGFFGKYYLLIHAMESQQLILVIVGLASSLISAYYYLRLVKILWFEGAEDADYTLVLGQPYSTTGIIVSIAEALQWVFIITSPLLLPYATTYTSNLLGQWTLPNTMMTINNFSEGLMPALDETTHLTAELSLTVLVVGLVVISAGGAVASGATYLLANKGIQASWFYTKALFSTKTTPLVVTNEITDNLVTATTQIAQEITPFTGSAEGFGFACLFGAGLALQIAWLDSWYFGYRRDHDGSLYIDLSSLNNKISSNLEQVSTALSEMSLYVEDNITQIWYCLEPLCSDCEAVAVADQLSVTMLIIGGVYFGGGALIAVGSYAAYSNGVKVGWHWTKTYFKTAPTTKTETEATPSATEAIVQVAQEVVPVYTGTTSGLATAAVVGGVCGVAILALKVYFSGKDSSSGGAKSPESNTADPTDGSEAPSAGPGDRTLSLPTDLPIGLPVPSLPIDLPVSLPTPSLPVDVLSLASSSSSLPANPLRPLESVNAFLGSWSGMVPKNASLFW